VNYNNSLAAFQYAKGTLQQYNSVTIGEGPLPVCAQVRAVEHERERSKALLLRERAQPVAHTPCGGETGLGGLPVLPVNGAPSIPALLENAPKVPESLDAPLSPAPAPKAGAAARPPLATPQPSVSKSQPGPAVDLMRSEQRPAVTPSVPVKVQQPVGNTLPAPGELRRSEARPTLALPVPSTPPALPELPALRSPAGGGSTK
jgi:hypothetical protein